METTDSTQRNRSGATARQGQAWPDRYFQLASMTIEGIDDEGKSFEQTIEFEEISVEPDAS